MIRELLDTTVFFVVEKGLVLLLTAMYGNVGVPLLAAFPPAASRLPFWQRVCAVLRESLVAQQLRPTIFAGDEVPVRRFIRFRAERPFFGVLAKTLRSCSLCMRSRGRFAETNKVYIVDSEPTCS